MTEVIDPGVATPPVDPGAGDAPAPTAPNGSEPDTNAGKPEGQTVPLDRFQEVNGKAKAAEERAAKAEARAAELEATQSKAPQGDEDDIDPDVQKLLDNYVKKNGFVTKAELDAVKADAEMHTQVQNDVADLKTVYKDYDHQKVVEFAKENEMPITSKRALEAAYTLMNKDSILENARKSAVAEFQESGKSGGEKPGPGGAKAPADPKPTSLKERIHLARQRQ